MRLVWLSLVLALAGCGSVSPAFRLKLDDPGDMARFRQSTTLVVKTFANDAGPVVPRRVLQELQDGIIAQVGQCYPSTFEKVAREPTGAPGELIVSGAVTDYDEGNRFARSMVAGLGSAKLFVDVSLANGGGTELTRAEGRWVFAMGGIPGAVAGMGYLVATAGRQIADALAATRGAELKTGCADPGSVE